MVHTYAGIYNICRAMNTQVQLDLDRQHAWLQGPCAQPPNPQRNHPAGMLGLYVELYIVYYAKACWACALHGRLLPLCLWLFCIGTIT